MVLSYWPPEQRSQGPKPTSQQCTKGTWHVSLFLVWKFCVFHQFSSSKKRICLFDMIMFRFFGFAILSLPFFNPFVHAGSRFWCGGRLKALCSTAIESTAGHGIVGFPDVSSLPTSLFCALGGGLFAHLLDEIRCVCGIVRFNYFRTTFGLSFLELTTKLYKWWCSIRWDHSWSSHGLICSGFCWALPQNYNPHYFLEDMLNI